MTGQLDAFCSRWVQAQEEADAVLQAPMTTAVGSAPGRLNEFMAVAYQLMSDLVPIAPDGVRPNVIVLRDYYKSELDGDFKAETPAAVEDADESVTAWATSHC